MKKQLIWVLTLVLLALFPYQSVRADYCSPAGNMTNTHTSGKILDRKFTSFILSDGTNSVSLDNIQTSYTDAIYKDRTSEVLTTTVGATLNFSAMSDVSWMHGYVYIDYDSNETFSTTANNNGTTGGELVSYNYYNGKNINNATMGDGCGVSASNIPSWTLPSNLTPGEYRLRFKIDWNSLDPCGSSDMASNNGCVVDITLKVVPSYPKMTYFYSNNIQQANRYLKEVVATQGGNTTTVFSASSESDLPRVDPTGANTVLNEAQGALVDKTGNPIIIDQGATEFTINFKGWTNNMTIGTSCASELNWTQQAVFIDWNNDFDFLDSGEIYEKSSNTIGNDGGVSASFISAAGYTRTISIPQGVQPGTYRMRVCYYEPTNNSDNWHEKLFTEYGAKTRNGKSYDFAINVVSSTYTINVASTAGGSAEITAGGSGTSATVNSGSSVTLTATPAEGNVFVNWTNSAGTVVSTDAIYTFNATKTDTYTANFVKECTVSVTIPDATQGTITINGEEATASHTITEGTSVELRANPKAGYKFEKWVINGSEQTVNPYTTTVTFNMTVAAVFAQLKQFTFNVTQPEGATITVTNSEGQTITNAYEGETITVEINPDYNYKDIQWFINGAVQAFNVITLTDDMPETLNITATLTKMTADEVYEAMSKPIFTEAGNLKAVDTYAEILEGSIGATAGAVDMSTLTTVKIGDHTWKQGATAPIYLSPGAEFSLKTKVHATTFYGMQLYLLHNTADTILESYGYYGTSSGWDTDEFWAEVNADTKISADQSASTITFPITLPESVKVGDIVVLRAISTATVTSPTVSAVEGVYVDYLFHVVEPTVITNVAPENSGTVTMSPADVADIKIGTQVTLTATPADGYTIVNWTDANGSEVAGANTTYIFNASKDNVYTVNFAKEHTVTIESANSGWGSVNFSGEDPSVNSKIVGSGSSLTVVATPAPGYAFVNWILNEEIVSTNASYTFEVTDNLSLTATFAAKTECTVTVTPVEGGSVTYTVGGVAVDKIYEGDEVIFTATPNAGYEFVRWTDESGNPLSTANPYTVTVNADMTIAPVYESVPIEIDLFNTSNGSLSIPPYRIPGIAKTRSGRLIAVAARLVCGTDPGYGQVDVVCRTSDNNGVNWSDIKDVAVGNGQTSATKNYFETAYGDPAIVADRTSDEVAIFVVAGCTVYANNKTTRQNPNMIGVIRSTDNGSTWGTPENITEQIYSLFDNGNPIQSAFIAGGKVFQSRIVKVGNYYRLYAAMCARPNGNRVIYSDDFGRTWLPLGGEFALPVPNGDEPKCEELPDGRVIVSSRVSGGRYYNIFTYTNTASATGSWQSQTLATLAQGSNATNGEILIVPVVRNSDSKEMYLALQSLPADTNGARKKVTIFYKELTSFDDYNTVTNFASGWDGSYVVTNETSAYSSMDLQADNKIAFIYEKNYTSFGRVSNPVSTCFPNGEGDHGYDGYDNTYVSYNLEYITNGAYTVKPNVNRGEIVKGYLSTLVEQSSETADVKAELKTKIAEFGDNPTTAQVDAIYSVLYADPWDGKVVTFTNVQQNGDKRALYINGSNVLSLGTTSQTAESLGASAQFLCIKQANGKYTFRNIATNNYMIYRNQDNPADATVKGANDNKGTLSTYDATYCDWTLGDGSGTKAGTYYMSAGRPSTLSPSSCQIVLSTGLFDGWARHEVAYTATYSNLYEINIVSSNVEQTLATAKTLINKTGVGYPKQGSSARIALQNAIAVAEANPTAAAGITLQNAINTYYTATDIELPTNGVLYSFIVGHNENKAYIYNNNGSLEVAKYTENMQLPETAKFTCEVNGEYFVFRTSDGKYIAFPNYGVENYTGASPDGIEDNISDLTKFSTTKLLGNGDKVTVSNEDLFGKIYLKVLLRGTVKEGDHAGETQSGVYVVKFKNNGSVLNPPVWDGASDPYGNDNFSSAISVVAMGYPLTATAEPAAGGTATVSPSSVSAGGTATFTASAPNAGYVFDGWYNGNEKLTGELVYNATNITTSLNFTAKYIQQGVVSVTVPSEFGKVMKGEDVVEGSISGNVGEIVQLTAVADEGYIFDRWVVKNTTTNQIRLKSTSTIDVELGTYEVEAYFAPEAYAQICKPTFAKSGNVFTVQSASISDGVGVENIDIVGTAFNMKNAGEVQPDLGEPAQWGATKAILVEPGATFTLNVEYMKNWADVELFINEGDGFTTIYGPYEGSDAAGLAFTNMENDKKISTSGNIASFPITISNNLEGGDIVVIRSASGSFEGNACKESLDQGGYLDFVFVVKNLPKRTVSVQVRPSDAAESVTINDLERTSLTASGDITINVEPKDGYRFVKWTDVLGNDVSTNKEYVDNSTQDTTYVANLVKLWKVTVTTNNRAWGIAEISGVDANGFVDNAADVTLTATSNNDARFMYWGLKTTENGEEVIKPVTTTNPFKTTILRNEDYEAVFEGDYPTMRLKYENGSGTDDERRVNRYLASVTATAGNLTTVVFEATNESGLPRIDAEVSAFYKHNEENLIPTTSGALIDKTGNAIMVKKGTETITLNFKSWLTNISLRSNTAEPELDKTEQAIFVDWNNDKDFLDDGEKLGRVSFLEGENPFEAADGYNREISIPASAECGTYRMRVIYYDNLRSSDDWTLTIFEDCVINQGRAYDFEIDIVDDANYITFDAPGETYFSVGDKANIQMTYPNNDEAVIYYTTDGFDPDENSPSITNGGAVAINTLQEGMITLKAIAMVDGVKSQVYKAVYTVVSKSSNLGAPTIKSAEDATTIIAAEISQGDGIANGPIDYNFTQGQQVRLNAIPTTATATFSLDVTLDLNKYGLLIYRLDALKNTTQKSIQLTASYTTDEIVSVSSFKEPLESKGFLYDIIDEAEGKIKIKIPVEMAMNENYYLSNGESVIYRLIVTNKAIGNNVTLLPDQDYGIGEYVDFVFTVSPQTTKTKVAGGAGKQLSFTITTDDACYLSVGGYAQNLDEAGTTTIQAPLNVVGEMEIQSVGANISKMDVEILEYGTNVVLPNVDYLGTVTVKSDAKLNATTISYASQLPAEGIHLVVEKEIYVPHVNDNDPTYFNFLSMPFEFDCGLNIEYWDGDSWETAVLEKDIRILKYKARTRAQGKDYYDYTWSTIGGTGGMIYANEGFVLVGNSEYGDADHKMKIRFKSFYPTDNTNVKRELKYFQDGGIKTVGVLPYRNTQGETHVCDADWNHIGSPYLTYTDAIDYVVYYHNGYSYQSVSPLENRQVRPFESFMFQANMEQLNQKDIAFFPLSANNQNSALSVYGRAYLAINGEETVKIILNDEASENFVVNEDGWYMAPTTDVFSTMSLKVADAEASMSVQPEPNELPLTIYTGVASEQTISLSRFDGEQNVFLKDAVTGDVVCLNDEDYTFTATPYSTISDRFAITMIEPTGICDQPTTDGDIKAVVTTDGIKLFGTVEGDEVTLYSANGMVIANAVAEDGITNIETSANGVIIIKVAEETVKVVK